MGCPHAPPCPGCPLIGLSYADGLARKLSRAERALARHPELAGARLDAPLEASPVGGYRVRAKLVTDNRARLGLYLEGSHELVDIPRCAVLAPPLLEVAAALRALLPLEVPLSGVDLRLVDRGVLVTLVVVGEPERDALRRAVERLGRAAPSVLGVAVSAREPGSVQMLGRGPELVWGSGAEPHRFAPDAPWHLAAHGAFTQAHPGQAARLHGEVAHALAEALGGLEGKRVLELYAGSGALALALAARGAQVHAVERFEPALARLREAASAQRLEVELTAADAAGYLAQRHDGVDAVVVNPPRRGLEPLVRERIARLAPKALAYVSCEPQTLARDLAHLARLGLGSERVLPIDMIPLSEAVECFTLLTPAAPPRLRVVYEDRETLAVDKPAFESLAPGSAALARLAREGQPGLRLLFSPPPWASGVAWLAKPAARADERLATAEVRALVLAHGVTHKKGRIVRPRRPGHPARLRYVRRSVVLGHSLLDVLTDASSVGELGRMFAGVGHALLGDAGARSAASSRHFFHRHGLDRPFLHVQAVESGGASFTAPLAADLEAVLDSLEREHRPHDPIG